MSSPPSSVLRSLHPAFLEWLSKHRLQDNLGFGSYFSQEEIMDGAAAVEMLEELGLGGDELEEIHNNLVLFSGAVEDRLRAKRVEFAQKGSHDFYDAQKHQEKHEATQEQIAKVARREQGEQQAQSPAPPVRPLYGSRLRRAQALEGDSAARFKAEEAERQKWLQSLLGTLRTLDAPSVRKTAKSKYASELLELQVGAKRAGTLRMRARGWARYREWLQLTYGLSHPLEPHHLLDYLMDRRAEPCSRGVLANIVDTVRFAEERMGLAIENKITEREDVRGALRGILQSTSVGTKRTRGPANAPLVWCIVELERIVMELGRPTYDRMLGWWLLVSAWSVLRFDDHRGIESGGVQFDELGLHLTMSRTKTTGEDKKVQIRPGFVAWGGLGVRRRVVEDWMGAVGTRSALD